MIDRRVDGCFVFSTGLLGIRGVALCEGIITRQKGLVNNLSHLAISNRLDLPGKGLFMLNSDDFSTLCFTFIIFMIKIQLP